MSRPLLSFSLGLGLLGVQCSLVAQVAVSPNRTGSTPQIQDPALAKRPDGTYLVPHSTIDSEDDVELQKVVDAQIMPLAVQIIATSHPSTPVVKTTIDQNGRSTPLPAIQSSIQPSRTLLRAELAFALKAELASGGAMNAPNIALAPGQLLTRPDPVAAINQLSDAKKLALTKRLLTEVEALGHHGSPSLKSQNVPRDLQAPVREVVEAPAFFPMSVERLTWSWDAAPNWSASVPGSTDTITTSFDNNPEKANTVMEQLTFQWTMAGGAIVWPESLGASGTWLNDGSPDGVPMTTFNGAYANDTTTYQTFDRWVEQFQAQDRIRWKTQANGTVQKFHMDGSGTIYVAPPELPSDGHLPRQAGDAFKIIEVGLSGWTNVGVANKKSTGLVMPAGSTDGRVPADQNTGINGGDRVYLSVDGAIQYRSPDGFYFNIQSPNWLRIAFEPADGSPEELLYSFNFPRTFTKRGSLYVFLDQPTYKWTSSFARGGYAVALTIQRSPDTDHDGLTDFEETNGIAGWKTKLLRRSDPKKIDTDGDTISDFDEVFGWQYVDRRSGEKRRADDTDPQEADEFYARQYLRDGTYYKFRFRRSRDQVSYANALSYIDDASNQSMRNAFLAAKSVAQSSGNYTVLLDAIQEQSTLELFRAQDALQRAYQSRFLGVGLDAIGSERTTLTDAGAAFTSGLNCFFGSDPRLPEDDNFTTYYSHIRAIEATRKPWDTDAGEDPTVAQPYIDVIRLASLLSGYLEVLDTNAELYHFQSDYAPSDLTTRDTAKELLVSGLAYSFIGDALVEGQIPVEQLNSNSVMPSLKKLANRTQAVQNRYVLLDQESANSLGIDPSYVRLVFNPETDPAISSDNPKNNFSVMTDQLRDPLRPLQLAATEEAKARADQRTFESNNAQFEQARLQNQIVYDQELTTYNLDFNAAKSQVNIATQELDKARNELTNIYSRIQIEQQRVADKAGIRYEVGQNIAEVFLDTGEQLAANEYALGEINATDAEIQGVIQAASSSSMSFGFPSGISASVNPGQMLGGIVNSFWGPYAARERAALAASNQRIQALEKARVQMLNVQLENKLEQADSEAHVKAMLLDIANATIDVRIKLLELCDSVMRMQTLATTIQETEVKRAEADQSVKNLFGDPSYRLIRDNTMEQAEALFEKAQQDVFLTARAFEYETTWSSRAKKKVFIARSADDLKGVVADLVAEGDNFTSATTARIPTVVKISLREDILGFKWGQKDPQSGQDIDPTLAFRNYLKSISTGDQKVFRIEFYGAMDEWAVGTIPDGVKTVIWSIPRSMFDTKIQYISAKLVGVPGPGHLGDEAATVRIELGGLNWIRSSEGTEKPPADSVEPWKFKENVIRNSIVRFRPGAGGQNSLFNVPEVDEDRTVPVQVGSTGQEFKWWGLFDQSPVRKWVITLNLAEGGNTDINIDALDDIELDLLLRSYDLP